MQTKALICVAMIVGLDSETLKVALGWMLVGLLMYLLYSRQHSKLRNPSEILPRASDFEKH